jgi:hypothetical protein
MKEIQPPITTDQELAGYRSGLAKLEDIMHGYEKTLNDASQDPDWLDYTRSKLRRVYNIRQGIIDAISDYLKQQKQSA